MSRLLAGFALGLVAGWLLFLLFSDETTNTPRAPRTDDPTPPPRTAAQNRNATASTAERDFSRLRDQLENERARSAELARELRELVSKSRSDAATRSALVAPQRWLQELLRGKFADLTIEQLQHMRELDLSSSQLDVHDLAHLAHLRSLRWLTLRRTNTDDNSLAYLLRAPSLIRLGLRETKVTDAGMPTIGAMRRLEHLDLNMLPITDDGLAQIRTLANLRFLRLNFTRVTNAGMKHVAQLRNLRRLDLWATKVTDAGLDEIRHLPHLEHLELGSTRVTKEWVDRFLQDHPDCYVHSRFSK
jgi:hypothetical protein